MHPTVVMNVVGLTQGHLGDDTPHLSALAARGASAALRPVLPAVTSTVQATFVTGALPRDHGVVGNGWYFRDLEQVWFWRQSDRLVAGEKVWDAARRRDPTFTCAKLFWWFNMYGSAELSVTPRPIYPADGRKIPDIYSRPGDLAARLTADLGPFPFFNFWGPQADLRSSEWIAEASLRLFEWDRPTLTLVYLPHLDYDLQRFGPDDPRVRVAVRDIDRVCGRVIDAADAAGQRVLVLSEYGITGVSAPVHINRALRDAGWIAVRSEFDRDMLDPGASRAFAVADHQIAHIYVRDPADIAAVRALVDRLPGVDSVHGRDEQAELGLDHPRAGELVALAEADRWFTYYYWLDDVRAPDYARTVDIHRKPGYDPAELFVDPAIAAPKLKVGWTLLKKTLGFRYLMEMIPLDAGLVRGSHGRVDGEPRHAPVVLSSEAGSIHGDLVQATDIKSLILSHLFDDRPSSM